jgi:hypothetical protein
MTATTVDAHADRLSAYLNDFCLYTVLLQGCLYLLQTAKRISIGSWTAVNEEYFALLA